MKKTLVIILAIFMAFIFSTKVIAQDGPPLEVIDNFPTQYLEYIEGWKNLSRCIYDRRGIYFLY